MFGFFYSLSWYIAFTYFLAIKGNCHSLLLLHFASIHDSIRLTSENPHGCRVRRLFGFFHSLSWFIAIK
uniref:Uncharacterized protein n=1 Tax=Pararge aegeria TaxID=116150 RepID=S4PGV9_9NEOP